MSSEVSIEDLIDLVVAEVPESEKRLEKIFEWRVSRELETAKWVLGLSATIAAALLVSVFKAEITANFWQALILVAIPSIPAVIGFWMLQKAKDIQKQYLSAIRIQSQLMRVKAFLIAYRRGQ